MSRNSKQGQRRVWRHAILTAVVAATFAVAALVNTQAQGPPDLDNPGQGDDAVITVVWDLDGMGFNVTSTKDISNIIVQPCPPGDPYKIEDIFEEENLTQFDHRNESFDILAIWVKSGNNHDPENPAPPPFNNRGAGEKFENPFADCEEEPVPECPSDFDATVLANGDVLLTWVPDDNADGYRLFRQVGNGSFEQLADKNGTDSQHLDDNTTRGETYTYAITLLDGRQVVERCGTDTVTVPPEEPRCVGPTNIQATANEDETISLSWDGVNGEDGYNIYRQVGSGSFEFLAHVGAPSTTFLDDNVTAGITYTYTVTATFGEEESDRCDMAGATAIPVFPSLIAASMAVFASIGAYGFLRRRQ